MSRGIELSPKHGLNPTIPVCFFCGEDKNEIALMGRVRERDTKTGKAKRGSDVEMPMKMVLDYEPCEKCREKFSAGVLLIGVTTHAPDGRPPLQQQKDGTCLYPTGGHAVMTPDGVQRCFDMNLEAGQRLLLEQEVLEHIFSQTAN